MGRRKKREFSRDDIKIIAARYGIDPIEEMFKMIRPSKEMDADGDPLPKCVSLLGAKEGMKLHQTYCATIASHIYPKPRQLEINSKTDHNITIELVEFKLANNKVVEIEAKPVQAIDKPQESTEDNHSS
jgi:hypothetical protein